MSNSTHRSICNRGRRLFVVAAGVTMLFASVAVSAQERTTLRKVEILGLQRQSPDQVIATSGLKVGEPIDASMIDAAAARLMRSGWFQSVDYRVRTADSDTTVIFEVVEKAPRPSTATGEIFGEVIWSGNSALSNQELNAAFGLRPGDSASLPNIGKGLDGVKAAYGRRGFINVDIRGNGGVVAATQRVTYQFTIREGQQYRMGLLSITGLPPADSRQLSSKWMLASGAVFDDAYLEQFRTTVLRPFVAARTQRTGIRSKFEMDTKPDTQKQTVDVLITFK